jgi:hypothetical protein
MGLQDFLEGIVRQDKTVLFVSFSEKNIQAPKSPSSQSMIGRWTCLGPDKWMGSFFILISIIEKKKNFHGSFQNFTTR